MKKLLLGLALSLSVLSATPLMAAAPTFSATQMAQVKITELSFKEIMRQFYNDQMFDVHIDNKEDTPDIGLGKDDDSAGETVDLMRPVIQYKNTGGEDRYLIIIEKIQASTGDVDSCYTCNVIADLYSFKKLNNGLFQLVSQTSKSIKSSNSNTGLELHERAVQAGLQPLGKNLMGSIFMNSHTSTGRTDSWWDVLHLPENAFIDLYTLGDAGTSNAGIYEEDSPLYFDYDVDFKVLPKNATYYPIRLTHKDEDPTEDYDRINSVNYSEIVKFNPVKKEYE